MVTLLAVLTRLNSQSAVQKWSELPKDRYIFEKRGLCDQTAETMSATNMLIDSLFES